MADFSQKSTISITCPKRITPFLKQELVALGFPVKHERIAGIETNGSLNDCMLLNLSLRTAHRVHFLLKSFEASNADELYNHLVQIPWEDYIHKFGYVSVTSFINNNNITNTQFANLKVKDAIADRIRKKTGARPDSGASLDKTVVFLFWNKNQAQIYLDTSGESISKRGYRSDDHTAPMQESLAAALIMASKWQEGGHFINPMCGSGTLAVEAALMALNRAPGLLRPNFGVKHILGFDAQRWDDLRADLKARSAKTTEGRIIASDNDDKAIKATRRNLRTAGLEHIVELRKHDFKEAEIPAGNGAIMMNPPYGERLGNAHQLGDLYRQMGDFLKQKGTGYWGYIFTGNMELAKKIGLRSNRRIEFYNSVIDARLLEFELY